MSCCSRSSIYTGVGRRITVDFWCEQEFQAREGEERGGVGGGGRVGGGGERVGRGGGDTREGEEERIGRGERG